MWRATTAKTAFITSRSATPSNGQDLTRRNSSIHCFDTLMRALPKTYQPLHAEAGTTVMVVLNDGNRLLSWFLVADFGRCWSVHRSTHSSVPAARVIVVADFFWWLAKAAASHAAKQQNIPDLQVTSAAPLN